MAKASITEQDVEREFKPEELFFSTTDDKGIIKYGNEVFTRIAGYTFDDLVGKPHNIIRHSHMPRCVFNLIWDYIQAGKTIGGYVKNLAKDGCYYWVYALVMPCGGGYLSIRLKPTSPTFETVKGVYEGLLEVEQGIENSGGSRDEAMEASTAKLLEVFDSVGITDYDEFMTSALVAEMVERDKTLAELGDGASNGNTEIGGKLGELYSKCSTLDVQLGELFGHVGLFVPMNKEIIEQAGSVLELAKSVRETSLSALDIAGLKDPNARKANLSGAIDKGPIDMNKRVKVLSKYLNEIMFAVKASKLKVEMCNFFMNEISSGSEDRKVHGTEKELQHNIDLLVESCTSSSKEISANFLRYILRLQIALQAFE